MDNITEGMLLNVYDICYLCMKSIEMKDDKIEIDVSMLNPECFTKESIFKLFLEQRKI